MDNFLQFLLGYKNPSNNEEDRLKKDDNSDLNNNDPNIEKNLRKKKIISRKAKLE